MSASFPVQLPLSIARSHSHSRPSVRLFWSRVCRSFHFRRRGGRAEERLERERGADDGARRTNFFKALHSDRSLVRSLSPSFPRLRPAGGHCCRPVDDRERPTDRRLRSERASELSARSFVRSFAQLGRRRVVSVL